MVTFQDRLIAVKFRPSGFDYMRLILAFGVILLHSIEVSSGMDAALGAWHNLITRPMVAPILPMFFALSGFLVAGSLERADSHVSFLGQRLIRLVPALAVEVTLSALLLGPIFTTTPLHQYYSDRQFLHYFLNIAGDVHLKLPGVFLQNPYPQIVNSQLWTIPYELKCYWILTALATFSAFRSKWFLLAIMIITQVAAAAYAVVNPLPFAMPLGGDFLIGPFLAGLTLYRWRNRVPWNGFLALAAGVLMLILLRHSKNGDVLIALPTAYVTAYLGMLNPIRTKIVSTGDYSYGMYLYAYPIQQGFAALGAWTHHWWLNMLVCLPLSVGFAVFSWRVIEKRALRLKKPLMALERLALRWKLYYWYTQRFFVTRGDVKPIQDSPARIQVQDMTFETEKNKAGQNI